MALAILLPALLMLKLFSRPEEGDQIIDDARFHITAEENSAYGQIKVVDVNNRIRVLVLDGLTQNAVDLTSGFSIHEYTYALPLIAKSYHPEGRTALAIGLGAGTVPSELRKDGLSVDCVEINPVMVRVSEKYFGFKPDKVSEKSSGLLTSENSGYLMMALTFSFRMPDTLSKTATKSMIWSFWMLLTEIVFLSIF